MRQLAAVIPWRSLVVAAAALAVAALPDLAPLLSVDRDAIAAGELWRLWTGHVVHGSAEHLLWNLLGLIGLGLLFERVLGSRLWWVLAGSAPLVGLGSVVLQPELSGYFGLSGVLNAIWVVGALMAARVERRRGNPTWAWVYRLCVVADLAKIGWEAFGGGPIFTGNADLGGVAVPVAHALGALGGMSFLFAVAVPGAATFVPSCTTQRET